MRNLAKLSRRLVEERGFSALEKTDPDDLVTEFGVTYEEALAMQYLFPKMVTLVQIEGGKPQDSPNFGTDLYLKSTEVDEGIIRLHADEGIKYNSHCDVAGVVKRG